jgi:hypothetical protein
MPSIYRQVIEGRHPIYTQNAPLWTYFADHYCGGPLYAQKANPLATGMITSTQTGAGAGRYISQHSLEDAGDYISRICKAPAVNLCGPAADMLAGTIGGSDTVSMSGMEPFQELLDDADLQGSSFHQCMAAARTQAAVHGHVFILADSTRASGQVTTQADILAQHIRPYFRTILPSDMLSWRLDSFGRPIEILFRVQVEAPGSLLDGAGAKDRQFEYRYWSREKWIVYREDGSDYTIADTGDNPLNEVPLATLYHKRVAPFLGDSLLKESARFSHLLSNWLSDLDQTMTQQSFSQACLRSEDLPAMVGVGTARILHLRPGRKEGDITYEGDDFFYRAPDAAPLSVMWDSFFRVVDLANSSMDLKPEATTDQSHPESGISRAWRWHSTEKRLTSMALNEQECARSLFQFAARWKGMESFTGSIVYGTHFDLSSLEEDISAMLSLQTAGLPVAAQNELKSRAVKKALPNLDPSKAQEIDAALKAMSSSLNSRATQDMLNNIG